MYALYQPRIFIVLNEVFLQTSGFLSKSRFPERMNLQSDDSIIQFVHKFWPKKLIWNQTSESLFKAIWMVHYYIKWLLCVPFCIKWLLCGWIMIRNLQDICYPYIYNSILQDTSNWFYAMVTTHWILTYIWFAQPVIVFYRYCDFKMNVLLNFTKF